MNLFCPRCGESCQDDYSFCPACGNPFQPRKKSRGRSHKSTVKPPSGPPPRNQAVPMLYGFLGILLPLFAIGMYAILSGFTTSSSSGMLVNQTLDPMQSLNPDVIQVASYFNCSCGNCNEEDLASCQCPTAQDQRAFIAKELDQGKRIEDVRQIVFETYAHAKPPYREWFDTNKIIR